jgi:hypothetical protein
MRNPTNEISQSFEDIKIEGIDQQRAETSWAKLEEETHCVDQPLHYGDQTLVHSSHVFYCMRNSRDTKISDPHYLINIFPPNSDPAEDDSFAEIILVQEKKDHFTVIQDSVETNVTTSLTREEVNSLLEKIANSTRETNEQAGETKDVIRQTRERLQ